MNREETRRAVDVLSASPAAKWIGNKLVGGVLLQKCTRCGAEQSLELPPNIQAPTDVPPGFDEKLFAWKRDFQIAHEGCVVREEQVVEEARIVDHTYLSAGDAAGASGDRPYVGCFHCGRSRQEHAA